MSSELKVAFIGTGGIAKQHLKRLKKIPGNHIVGLCDLDISRAEAAAAEHGGKAYNDMSAMLDKEKPNAVLICTPPFARIDPIAATVERRIPFFCEKPPAFSLDDARRAQAIVDSSNLPHSVGFMYRHLQIADKARDLLAGRTILLARSAFITGPLLKPDFPAWFKLIDKSGGPMLDQAIHIIDFLRFLLGDVETVYNIGSNRVVPQSREVTVQDTLSLALAFQNGVGGTHHHAWASEMRAVEIEIYCKDARLKVDLRFNTMEWEPHGGTKEQFAPGDDCYETELTRFLNAVRTGDSAPIRSTYADAVKTLATCIAANRSASSKKVEAVVS